MTSLKSTVDTQWQNILNEEAGAAQTGTRFNFYTSLKNMATAVDNTLPTNFFIPFWNPQSNNQNTRTFCFGVTNGIVNNFTSRFRFIFWCKI